MLCGGLILKQASIGALVVSANTSNIAQSGEVGTIYAGLQINTSGVEARNSGAGSTNFTVSRGNWLDAGGSDEVWVIRTISGDALNWTDPGAGRLQLDTTREYGISIAVPGQSTASVTFVYWDAAADGNQLDSVTIDISVEKFFPE